MNPQLFAATMRTSEIVGRESEMDQIKQAIFRPADDNSCQLVFIQGRGGFGKTRLLEETLWRLGHPSERNESRPFTAEHRERGWDWSAVGNVVVLGLIDLINIHLRSSNNFVFELHRRFEESGIVFSRYLDKRQRHQQLVQQNVDYLTAQRAAEEAVTAFFEDYAQLTRERRVLWVIDTAEQLSHVSSEWLRTHWDPHDPEQKPLLQDRDMRFETQQWLAEQLGAGRMCNTTLLCAGREEEGEAFFRGLAARFKERQPLTLSAQPLTAQAIQEYFAILARDWERLASEATNTAEARANRNVAGQMRELASDSDRAKVFRLYTKGQPVLISFFADLIVEHNPIPEPLLDTYAQAIRRVGTNSLGKPTPELRWAQWQIEDEFITLLFSRPRGRPTLYRDILETLVRAPRGLSPEQLHFVLDSPFDTTPDDWKPDQRQLAEITEAISSGMHRSSLLKRRQNGIGLQDEIYRIYAEHMAPHVYPHQDVQQLWNEKMSEEDRERYRRNHDYEQKARSQLYTQLRDWADCQQRLLRKKQAETQVKEERELEIRLASTPPTQPRSLRFPSLSSEERKERLQIYTDLVEASLEYMHYALLLDPSVNFNLVYTDLADELWRANDEDRDAITQAEMWRVLHDPYVLRFVDLPTRPDIERRREIPLLVLQRATQQETVTRWLKRFVLRKDYARAIEFADAAERAIQALPEVTDGDVNEKESWLHTLTWGERQTWREYARIFSGREIHAAIESLKKVARDLVTLAQHTTNQVALPGKGRWGEKGFIGHPAEIRLRRVTSLVYNFMGWGCVGLRQFREAVRYYGRALYFARETGMKAHRASVLNNLSRAQSEMGRQRAVRLCFDGLSLRREVGADFPIALSHSTLAVIYNDQHRPEEAWREAAKAMAYARRVEDSRVLGLALMHLGEALRWLARQEAHLRRMPREAPDAIYDAAQEVLEEAHALFSDPESPASREVLRLIEANIELGCLHRDRLRAPEQGRVSYEWRARLGKALAFLGTAAQMAMERRLTQVQLDAVVNTVWTHFYARNFVEVERSIGEADQLIQNWVLAAGGNRLLEPDQPPPTSGDHESIVYYQLSKLHHLRGRMAMDSFRQRADEIEGEYQGEEHVQRQKRWALVHNDDEAQGRLNQAAEAYVKGIAYAQLFSPRSSALSALYDSLYDYLKAFNQQELDDFTNYERAQRQRYQVDRIEPEDLGNLDEFLSECFGELTARELANGAGNGY